MFRNTYLDIIYRLTSTRNHSLTRPRASRCRVSESFM